MVRAKMTCESKEVANTGDRDAYNIVLVPVTGGSDENKQFYRWTPSGKIELNTINATAAGEFEVGHSYYVDFTRALG